MKTLAAILTMVLLAGSVMPASAQGPSFGIFFGDQRSDFFSPKLGICLTDRQIRDAISQRGYSSVTLNVPDKRHVQVRATRDGWVYLLNYNYCSDRIDGVQRLRRAG